MLAHNQHISQLHLVPDLEKALSVRPPVLSDVAQRCVLKKSVGDLDLKHFLFSYHTQNVNQALRFLSDEGPVGSIPLICHTLFSLKTNHLWESLADSCYAHALHLGANGFGPWSPCPVSQTRTRSPGLCGLVKYRPELRCCNWAPK